MNGSIFQNFQKFEPKLAEFNIFKNRAICSKFGPIDLWTGHFFLKSWYLYGSTFKFCGSTSIPKPNLSTPPPVQNKVTYCFYYSLRSFNPSQSSDNDIQMSICGNVLLQSCITYFLQFHKKENKTYVKIAYLRLCSIFPLCSGQLNHKVGFLSGQFLLFPSNLDSHVTLSLYLTSGLEKLLC